MKRHIGPFLKLLLLLAFLSRLEFVFGQERVAIIGISDTQALHPFATETVKAQFPGFSAASTLGNEQAAKRLELKALPKAFSSKTDLSFTLNYSGTYKLEILNMHGNVVTVLAEGEGLAGESFVFQFKRERLPTGPYIGRLITAHEVTSARFLLK